MQSVTKRPNLESWFHRYTVTAANFRLAQKIREKSDGRFYPSDCGATSRKWKNSKNGCHPSLLKTLFGTRRWFQTCYMFIPTWGDDPIWPIFFRWGKKPPTREVSWYEKNNDQVIQAKWPDSWFPAYMNITSTNLFRVAFQLIRITLEARDFLLYHTWVYWDIGIYDYGLLWFIEEKRMHEFHRQPRSEWTSNGWHKYRSNWPKMFHLLGTWEELLLYLVEISTSQPPPEMFRWTFLFGQRLDKKNIQENSDSHVICGGIFREVAGV